MSYFKTIAGKIGIDQAIGYSILARILQAGGGVVSILFITNFLTKVEQGYYYTFGSLLAIQIFFELGLTSIITQFVAHEMANLKWIDHTKLSGPEESKSRLSSLLRFSVKWFSIIGFVLFFVLVITGYIFFKTYKNTDSYTNWEYPWAILCISTGGMLFITPILAFLEGLGFVKDVAKIRLIQQVCLLALLFLGFVFGLKLFSSPIASIVSLIIAPFCIFLSNKRKILVSIWNDIGKFKVSYSMEIFPYQWKIALSWISGYFMYQLFNPILFAKEGPAVAGQMGMTLAALNGVMSVSLTWINTKVPLFSNLIARKEFKALDVVFNRTLKQACVICLLCIFALLGLVIGLKYKLPNIGNRFLPILPLVLLATSTFVNQLISALATYLRCHKQEPFLVFSIVMAILTVLSTFIMVKYYGLIGMVLGYTMITVFIGLAWSIVIFINKKRLWHL